MKIIVLFTVILALFTYNTEGQPDLKSKTISQHNFKKLLKKENAEILDVRTPEEYNAWHMENAINIDFNNENFLQQILQLDKNKTYLLYCHSGRRSGKALLLMYADGFTKVYHLKDGVLYWSGNPQKK